MFSCFSFKRILDVRIEAGRFLEENFQITLDSLQVGLLLISICRNVHRSVPINARDRGRGSTRFQARNFGKRNGHTCWRSDRHILKGGEGRSFSLRIA